MADNPASTSDSAHLVLTGSEAMEAEAESEERETLLIFLTPIPSTFTDFSTGLFSQPSYVAKHFFYLFKVAQNSFLLLFFKLTELGAIFQSWKFSLF